MVSIDHCNTKGTQRACAQPGAYQAQSNCRAAQFGVDARDGKKGSALAQDCRVAATAIQELKITIANLTIKTESGVRNGTGNTQYWSPRRREQEEEEGWSRAGFGPRQDLNARSQRAEITLRSFRARGV